MPDTMDPETRLSMFMTSSPFFVDLDVPNERDGIAERYDSLPQNIQSILLSEDTAAKIWNLGVVKHGLSPEHVKDIARIMRRVLTGETSAANLRELIGNAIDVSPAITDDIVKTLTQQIISANYFQISQLYERKQRGGGTESRRESSSTITPGSAGADGRSLPPNVVDLRNPRPSPRTPLPPSPPQMPSQEDEPPDNFPTPA